ncbi:MAG: hypothetical protein GY820_20230 [Gammaproteobacteria bacterium]|nr:hypothetical protein [Gammaproteobacteria bacterium]
MNNSKYPPPNLKNQALVVLKALEEGDKTTLDLVLYYYVLSPAARIFELRKNHIIRTRRLPSGMASYHLEGKIDG